MFDLDLFRAAKDTVGNALLSNLSPTCDGPGSHTHTTQADGCTDGWLVFHLPLNCNSITRKGLNFKSMEQLFETRYDAKASGLDSLATGQLNQEMA